jgi:hypothetical protein
MWGEEFTDYDYSQYTVEGHLDERKRDDFSLLTDGPTDEILCVRKYI